MDIQEITGKERRKDCDSEIGSGMNKDTRGRYVLPSLVKGEREAPCGRSRGLKENSRRGQFEKRARARSSRPLPFTVRNSAFKV